MRNDAIAITLGTSLAHAQEQEIPGLLVAIGEIAAHLRSMSGPPVAEEFLAQVRSASLRLLQSGVDVTGPVGPSPFRAADLLRELTQIEHTIGGSTAPSL